MKGRKGREKEVVMEGRKRGGKRGEGREEGRGKRGKKWEE